MAIHKRVYIITVCIITLLMILFAVTTIRSVEQLYRDKEAQELMTMAAVLGQRLPPSVGKVLSTPEFSIMPEHERRAALERDCQPVLDEMTATHPGYSMGYYFDSLKVIAVAPVRSNVSGSNISYPSLTDYVPRVLTVPYIENDESWDRQPRFTLTYPLLADGNRVGHVWVSVKMENIEKQVRRNAGWQIAGVWILWSILLLLMRSIFNKMDKTLALLAQEIQEGSEHPDGINQFPQLIPVLNTVTALRANLQSELQKKERMDQEIARLDRMQLISQMAAGVAHEIRNPMTVVMGFVQMMAQKAEEKAKTNFAIIMDELKRVNEIISDFLSLARNKDFERRKQQLNEIISSLHPLIYTDTVKQGLDFVLQLEEPLPEVYVDGKEIKQLILNLTRNAIEAMGEEKGMLMLKTSHNKGQVELCISDTGCGISQDMLDKVFDPFFTTKAEGTGLGLAVCKNIVEHHHGTMQVQSMQGQGTTFLIRFPAAK
ncbi:nitrogen regulation protein NR(II) [Propionispora sp. 2/2-37]|uniref:two-component system sensor histidine kinase NtrB n=1 Tax=Propionispora sp. 2/2-37 TaxID=1677858 RepID=UPI001F443F30|nr:ATP-binding protein [Propionispora sp. 2/2-37]